MEELQVTMKNEFIFKRTIHFPLEIENFKKTFSDLQTDL